MKPRQLEDRLINFAIDVIVLSKDLDNSFASEHLAKQLIRSASSAALHYGEAQGGEYPKDFLHKMKICLKELRESLVNLKIIIGAKRINEEENLKRMLVENNELISIFVVSIKTATKKLKI